MTPKRTPTPFPTREQILEFVRERGGSAGKREIARAFGIHGAAEREKLKQVLRDLQDDGALSKPRRRQFAEPGTLPKVAVLQITGTDRNGEMLLRPTNWDSEGNPPPIYLLHERGRRAPGIGDRVLARLREEGDGSYSASTIRVLESAPRNVLGIYTGTGNGTEGRIRPTDRRVKSEFHVGRDDEGKAKTGDFVSAEILERRHFGLPTARVTEVLGDLSSPNAASMIAIRTHGIPVEFPMEALAQARRAKPAPMGKRTDLRDVPLVTIDDEDARDFDDAVWAEPDPDPKNQGGWHLIVAIADVGWYVRPGDALDRAARERGNSVYFPDRVVPMLPEELSNGLCSLKPAEDRPCLAVHMWIDGKGQKIRHKFVRAMMRSAARLTYARVQTACDGEADEATAPLMDDVIMPLYGAFRALRGARDARGTIDLDLPELRVRLDDEGRISSIEERPRYDSHRLIEEFMITANVAAAEALEQLRQSIMYRVHEEPAPEKVEALREFLGTLGIRLAKGQVLTPGHFNRILEQARETPHVHLVNEMVLRTQSQAVYSPESLGHFGLALRRYVHFTSPIRRYSDLLVHRALITGMRFGEGGLTPEGGKEFEDIARHISATERRAMMAERDTIDRLTASFLADRVGATFAARIGGVARVGLYIKLRETGADGLVPMSSLGMEWFEYDEASRSVTGRETGTRYAMGDDVVVRLVEANPFAGSLLFELVRAVRQRTVPKGKRPKSGRPPSKSPRRTGAAQKRTKSRGRKR